VTAKRGSLASGAVGTFTAPSSATGAEPAAAGGTSAAMLAAAVSGALSTPLVELAAAEAAAALSVESFDPQPSNAERQVKVNAERRMVPSPQRAAGLVTQQPRKGQVLGAALRSSVLRKAPEPDQQAEPTLR
jgi:hypothetical protein